MKDLLGNLFFWGTGPVYPFGLDPSTTKDMLVRNSQSTKHWTCRPPAENACAVYSSCFSVVITLGLTSDHRVLDYAGK